MSNLYQWKGRRKGRWHHKVPMLVFHIPFKQRERIFDLLQNSMDIGNKKDCQTLWAWIFLTFFLGRRICIKIHSVDRSIQCPFFTVFCSPFQSYNGRRMMSFCVAHWRGGVVRSQGSKSSALSSTTISNLVARSSSRSSREVHCTNAIQPSFTLWGLMQNCSGIIPKTTGQAQFAAPAAVHLATLLTRQHSEAQDVNPICEQLFTPTECQATQVFFRLKSHAFQFLVPYDLAEWFVVHC